MPLSPVPASPPEEIIDATVTCERCDAACCRDVGDGTALVSAEDIVRWKRQGATKILDSLVPGHFGQQGLGTYEEGPAAGTCVHLGTPGRPNDCSVYDTRGECCHALVPGSAQCLSYRRRYYARDSAS